MRELETVLPDLAPPAGGLARLQRSVAVARRPAACVRARWAVAVAACAVAAITAGTLSPWIAQRQRTHVIVRALRAVVVPSPNGIKVADGAAIELPSAQANVTLYLVQTVRPAERAQ